MPRFCTDRVLHSFSSKRDLKQANLSTLDRKYNMPIFVELKYGYVAL